MSHAQLHIESITELYGYEEHIVPDFHALTCPNCNSKDVFYKFVPPNGWILCDLETEKIHRCIKRKEEPSPQTFYRNND